MAASLFTAPIATITAADVRAFLDLDQEEGPRVDYKAFDSTGGRLGIPETIYRAICAFANTYGGVLIIGVSSHPRTNRPDKREGIPLRSNIEEAITSKCLSQIFPPVAPEICVCPFASEEEQTEMDRAFVVVRVAASTATPHQMQKKDNRILVRVGSECRDPDLATLRALFERGRQQEERVEATASHLIDGIKQVRTQFMIPDNAGGQILPPRLAPGSEQVIVEFVPVDAPADLLSFWTKSMNPDEESPDYDILKRLASVGWQTKTLHPGDLIRLPGGLGVAAAFGTRPFAMRQPDAEERLVDIVYINSTGGMVLEVAAAALGDARPSGNTPNLPDFVDRLVKRVDRAAQALTRLLRAAGYGGRIQITAWVDTHARLSPEEMKQRGHAGTATISCLDDVDDIRRAIVPMISRMTRSWLDFPFTVKGWAQGGDPWVDRL